MRYFSSFLIASIIYSSVSASLYFTFRDSQNQDTVEIKSLPMSLSMFQIAQADIHVVEKPSETPPTIQPKDIPLSKPKPTLTPKPVVKPKPIPEPTFLLDPKEIISIDSKLTPQKYAPSNTQNTATTQTDLHSPTPSPDLFSSSEILSAEQRYLNELRNLLAKKARDSYPKQAKRRNWEGVVTLNFTIHSNGKIHHVKVTKSSGRKILDEAALAIIKDSMNNFFKPFPKESSKKEWIIQVPIQYKLSR